jgi:gliding motility-associated-like protein
MRRTLQFTFIFLLCQFTSRATHIAGGDFSVRWVSGNDFEVTLKLFRDCASGGAAFDSPINITVFDNVTNAQVTTFSMNLLSNTPIQLGDSCYSPPSSVCLEEGVYISTITLANNPNGYYLAWERCCRNPTIVNLQNPNAAGMVFYVQIPDPALQNSTPEFGAYPPEGYLCIDNLNIINFNVTESDGDSLVYMLDDPLMGSLSSSANPAPNSANPKPYPLCTWQAPYSLANIVGGVPPMTIDSQTGTITCTPDALGVFAFAVMIYEYRNGVKISETRREIQYYALNCQFDALPEMHLPDSVYIQVLTEGCFDIVVLDEDLTDSVSISVTSPAFLLGADLVLPQPYQVTPDTAYMFYFINQNTGQPDSIVLPEAEFYAGYFHAPGGVGLRFCWPGGCEDISPNSFPLTVEAYSLGCSGLINSIEREVSMFIVPPFGDEEIIPNVFSPNNDGINDEFYIYGTPNPCFDHLNVKIYNRWGQLVYESEEVNFHWNGTNLEGKDLPQGTYYVILNGVYGDVDVTRQYPVTIFR